VCRGRAIFFELHRRYAFLNRIFGIEDVCGSTEDGDSSCIEGRETLNEKVGRISFKEWRRKQH